MEIELIDRDSEKRRRAVLSALTLAFARDPLSRWLFPEPQAYLTYFPEFTAAFGGPGLSRGPASLPDRRPPACCESPSAP